MRHFRLSRKNVDSRPSNIAAACGNRRCIEKLGIFLLVVVTACFMALFVFSAQVELAPASIDSKSKDFHQPLRQFHFLTKSVELEQKKLKRDINLSHTPENTVNISHFERQSFTSKFNSSTSQFCSEKKPDVLIWIYSAPGHFVRRQLIRSTWGNATRYKPAHVFIVFSLGAVNADLLQTKVDQEQFNNKDIIQDVGFYDAYKKLTFKAQSMLRWSSQYCSGVKLLFKVDDDSYLLPERVSQWLANFSSNHKWPERSIIGTVWKSPRPHRKGKWKIELSQWPYSIYAPLSCPGSGYLISGDALNDMKLAIEKVPFLWLEDMYVTGVLATSVGLKYIDNSVHHQLNYRSLYHILLLLKKDKNKFLIGHVPDVPAHSNLWNILETFKESFL